MSSTRPGRLPQEFDDPRRRRQLAGHSDHDRSVNQIHERELDFCGLWDRCDGQRLRWRRFSSAAFKEDQIAGIQNRRAGGGDKKLLGHTAAAEHWEFPFASGVIPPAQLTSCPNVAAGRQLINPRADHFSENSKIGVRRRSRRTRLPQAPVLRRKPEAIGTHSPAMSAQTKLKRRRIRGRLEARENAAHSR